MTLINVNLTDAHNTFVSTLTAISQQNMEPEMLTELHQEKLDRLDHSMHVLTQLAGAGMEEQLAPLLSTLLQEWAAKEAIELSLRYQEGMIDPTHQGLQQAFWDKLGRQHQVLSSELLLQLKQGREQREQGRIEGDKSWQSVASRSIEEQRNQQQQWQNAAIQWVQGQTQQNQQWFQHEREMFSQYQQTNQQWANIAMNGVKQAQDGMKQWYDFAASTQANVAGMLSGTEQRQSMMVEQAVRQANRNKWMTRLMIVGLVTAGIVALFGSAFFAIVHLY